MKDFTAKLDLMGQALRGHNDEVKALEGKLRDSGQVSSACGSNSSWLPFVVSDDGLGSYHRTNNYLDGEARLMKTPCGWSYGASMFKRAAVLPDTIFFENVCKRCLPQERERQRLLHLRSALG